jgi:hypothetical protein
MLSAAPPTRYQILLLAADSSSPWPAALRATLELRARDLGLDPSTDLHFAEAIDAPSLLRNAPWVTVYFGGPTHNPAFDPLLKELVADGRFVLPVVPSTDHYTAQVPAALHPINGIGLDPLDPTLEAVAARVLEELRLLRARRKVFVSYRRAESRAVAIQLFHRLDERGFRPFLDTHRVAPGADFQAVLMDDLADAEVVVLLDTPRTLDSPWVALEIERASHLAIGVLQVVWPDHDRDGVTDLALPIYLEHSDLIAPPAGAPAHAAELTPAALDDLVTQVERVRARNLAARRTRLIEELCREARARSIELSLYPGRHLELRLPSGEVRVVPVLGHPSAEHYHMAFDDHGSTGGEVVLLHDTRGALLRRRDHLRWLDGYLPVKSLPREDVVRWLTRT